jgi:hypothetical protein
MGRLKRMARRPFKHRVHSLHGVDRITAEPAQYEAQMTAFGSDFPAKTATRVAQPPYFPGAGFRV